MNCRYSATDPEKNGGDLRTPFFFILAIRFKPGGGFFFGGVVQHFRSRAIFQFGNLMEQTAELLEYFSNNANTCLHHTDSIEGQQLLGSHQCAVKGFGQFQSALDIEGFRFAGQLAHNLKMTRRTRNPTKDPKILAEAFCFSANASDGCTTMSLRPESVRGAPKPLYRSALMHTHPSVLSIHDNFPT